MIPSCGRNAVRHKRGHSAFHRRWQSQSIERGVWPSRRTEATQPALTFLQAERPPSTASPRFDGRPLERRVDSRPRRTTVAAVHASSPYGRPRSTDSRIRCRSLAESGSFTRWSHLSSRIGAEPRHKSGSSRNQPATLDHFQSSARKTNSARSAFRSTYRNTETRCSSS